MNYQNTLFGILFFVIAMNAVVWLIQTNVIIGTNEAGDPVYALTDYTPQEQYDFNSTSYYLTGVNGSLKQSQSSNTIQNIVDTALIKPMIGILDALTFGTFSNLAGFINVLINISTGYTKIFIYLFAPLGPVGSSLALVASAIFGIPALIGLLLFVLEILRAVSFFRIGG